MSDGIINEWLDKQGNTEEARNVARLAVSFLMEDESPALVADESVASCADCGCDLTVDQVAYHVMEPDTGVWFYYCSDCAPWSYDE